ncbi:hypothetical protein SSX86_000294 [Deinandra increscens subsp. villosa]|uniref:Transmembrane protein n=1 Tax=Deinandra increscens subsp. villosa TaxID=3103831 RepID=A0AAP0HDC8_9ASTR
MWPPPIGLEYESGHALMPFTSVCVGHKMPFKRIWWLNSWTLYFLTKGIQLFYVLNYLLLTWVVGADEIRGSTGGITMAVAVAVRGLLTVLGGLMVAVLVYTIATDGLPFRIDLLTRWMAALLIDFYIHIAIIGAWVVYKESSWIMGVVWVVLLICLGSVTTCGYIVLQFFKLTPEESSKDPLYFVLVRHEKSDVTENRKGVSVITARVIFVVLGCLMLGTLLYTLIVDGSPFRSELYTPWVVATLIDFYINVVALSVWIAYKESSWMNAFLWILFLVCFGSITTCVYILRQLFYLSSDKPVFLILFRNNHRQVTDLKSSDPPLMVGANE